jgi:hypothetical protein
MFRSKTEFLLIFGVAAVLLAAIPLALIFGLAAIRSVNLIKCPSCGMHKVRRSSLVGVFDEALSMVGIFPFRCFGCRFRFHGLGSKEPPESGLLRQSQPQA